jgi:serine/threonine-protein kinase RsbW
LPLLMALTNMNDVVLRVPADPAFVHFLRSHTASLGAMAGFTIDDIDDIRLAVDEAAACLLDYGPGDSNFILEVSPKKNTIELWLSMDAPSGSWPPAGIESELAWKVLTMLSGEVSFEVHNGGPAIRILKVSGA